ncbi:MAG: hypothetical protein JAY69_10390 [Candidatus Thiodiazotropha taylori]|nr:hypothetical protein [Candidatus Thiodiazotropha taylori]MCG7963671.1 hypothetical protein [Candidatus Thiodiazotropha endolucinida]MCG7993987.1 hypothetical protein [Candidatus Thiodiazotropha taylori]MCG8091487.1 hypothetical protein [Candidatus Thiodiazotropha taylori]MCW4229709.1 hypothetical protein [Candidatus Thiodiazotropha taylori]
MEQATTALITGVYSGIGKAVAWSRNNLETLQVELGSEEGVWGQFDRSDSSLTRQILFYIGLSGEQLLDSNL